MAHSARLLVKGCYGADLTCVIAVECLKCFKFVITKNSPMVRDHDTYLKI